MDLSATLGSAVARYQPASVFVCGLIPGQRPVRRLDRSCGVVVGCALIPTLPSANMASIAIGMTPGEVVGFIFLGALFVEAVLLAFWVPAYYLHGIPAFREVVPLPTRQPDDLAVSLEARFDGGGTLPRLVFRRISDLEIGFQ